MKRTLQPPPTHTNSMPDLDETLKVGSWEHLEHIYDSQHGICPDNICPGSICPYQEYPRCY